MTAERRSRRSARALAPGIAAALLASLAAGPAASAEPLAPTTERALPNGTYRLDRRLATTTKFPMFGRSQSAWVSVWLVEIGEGANGPEQRHEICSVEVESGFPLMSMAIPDAYLVTFAKPPYPVELERDRDGGWRYRADIGVEHVGWEPEKAGARLPKRGDDPSLRDSDGDGKPGATILLDVPFFDSPELYVVQRRHYVLDGRVTNGPDGARVDGTIDVEDFAMRVIGAEPYFMKRTPKISPDAEHSHFSLVQVPAGTTCESLAPPSGDDAEEREAPSAVAASAG